MIMSKPYVSIVIPVYNEQENLHALFTRLTTVMDKLGKPYEILFTNDGSRDRSGAMLEEFHKQRPGQVRFIDFNGNFGQHMAIMAAFERVRGEVVVTLDADLQNPPEEIPKLLAAIEAGHDVVGGYRKNRHDSFFRKVRIEDHQRHSREDHEHPDEGPGLHAPGLPEEHHREHRGEPGDLDLHPGARVQLCRQTDGSGGRARGARGGRVQVPVCMT